MYAAADWNDKSIPSINLRDEMTDRPTIVPVRAAKKVPRKVPSKLTRADGTGRELNSRSREGIIYVRRLIPPRAQA